MSWSPQAGRGWYPDPPNPSRLRYWTGGRWTNRTRPAVPDIEGARPSTTTYVAAVSAVLSVAMSIPFGLSGDPEPGFDFASQPGSGLWLLALPLAVASLFLARQARRRELERRSSAGRALSTIVWWSAVVAVCVTFLPVCAILGSGL